MDYCNKSDLIDLKQQLVQVYEAGAPLQVITQEAMLWPYYLIAGCEEQTVIELTGCTPEGDFIAVSVKVGLENGMTAAEGNFESSYLRGFSDTLDTLRAEFERAKGNFVGRMVRQLAAAV